MTVNALGDSIYTKRGKILKISGKSHLHRRLAAIGLVVGAIITIVKRNTNTDDIEVSSNGRSVHLRENELAKISVKGI
jgi:Fe2+ transport system protein FeoA